MSDTNPAPEGQPKPRWKRRVALGVLGPLLLVTVLLTALWLAPYVLTGERLKPKITAALTELLGLPVQIGNLWYSPLNGLEAKGLRLGPPEGFTEPLFTADRLALGYRIERVWPLEIEVEALKLERPVFKLETQAGKTNLQAMIAHLSDPQAEDPEPSPPGPLLPLKIRVRALDIGPLRAELIGEGLQLKVDGVRLSLQGAIGPERLDAKLALKVRDDSVRLSPSPAASLSARTDLLLEALVGADTSRGIHFDRVDLDLKNAMAISGAIEQARLPQAELSLELFAKLRAKEDLLALERLQLDWAQAPLLRAKARIERVHEALDAVVEAPLASLLMVAARSASKTERPLSGQLEVLELPLGALAPWVAAFVPGMKLGGRVHLEAPLIAQSSLAGLRANTPEMLGGAVLLEQVFFEMDALRVAPIDGSIRLKREEAYRAEAQLQHSGVAVGELRLGAGALSAAAKIERLEYPPPGATEASVEASVAQLQVAGLKLGKSSAQVRLTGADVLSAKREGTPIATEIAVRSRGLSLKDSPIQLDKIRIDLDAKLDRLLDHSLSPIALNSRIAVDTLALPGDLEIEGVKLSLKGTVEDPRASEHFQTALKLSGRLAQVRSSTVSAKDVRLKVDVDGDRIGPYPKGYNLESLTTKIEVQTPLLSLALGEDTLRFPLEVALQARAAPRAGSLGLESLSVRSGKAARLRLSGRAQKLYTRAPKIDLGGALKMTDLQEAIGLLPERIRAQLPGLSAEGQVDMTFRARGSLPEQIDLSRPPLSANARIHLRDIHARSEDLELIGLEGRVVAELLPSGFSQTTDLSLKRVQVQDGTQRQALLGLKMFQQAGLKEGLWSVHSRASAERMEGTEEAVQGSSMVLDMTYPRRGDLDLRRLELNVAGGSMNLLVQGRLTRERFGVLRPKLQLRAEADLDRLKVQVKRVAGLLDGLTPLVPALKPAGPWLLQELSPTLDRAEGAITARLDVQSPTAGAISVAGALEVDRLGIDIPGTLTMVEATGRVPVEQQFSIPAPALRERVAKAVGTLGDDLEARIGEMVKDLQKAKLRLDSSDILVAAPRTADYQALRPFYSRTGARMKIQGIVLNQHAFQDILIEGLWRSGVLRLDRISARIWEGDILGELALQLTADRNIRVRTRAAVTDLNLDVPYALATQKRPVQDPAEKQKYRISGVMDFELAVKERSVNAKVDLVKLSIEQVERLFGTIDPSGDSPAVDALEYAWVAGVRPRSGQLLITQNLLSVGFDWERLWIPALDREGFVGKLSDLALALPRVLLIPSLGAWVINTVNGAIRRVSVGNVLDSVISASPLERWMRALEGTVVEAPQATASAPEY